MFKCNKNKNKVRWEKPSQNLWGRYQEIWMDSCLRDKRGGKRSQRDILLLLSVWCHDMNPHHLSSKERYCNRTKKPFGLGDAWLLMRNAIASHQTRTDRWSERAFCQSQHEQISSSLRLCWRAFKGIKWHPRDSWPPGSPGLMEMKLIVS